MVTQRFGRLSWRGGNRAQQGKSGRRGSISRSLHKLRCQFAGEVEGLEARALLAADPILNEFVAFNTATLQDQDGTHSDWLELYNKGDATSNLSGYYLTDDPANLTKWRIPDGTSLAANSYLTVFASGKNRAVAGSELHTNFTIDELGGDLALVAPNGTTIVSSFLDHPAMGRNQGYGRVRVSGNAELVAEDGSVRVLSPTNGSLGSNWTTPGFNDNSWTQLTSPIGYDTSMTASGFAVSVYYSTTQITNLATADAAIAGANLRPGSPHTGTYQVVNFAEPQGGGGTANFPNDSVFPGDTTAAEDDFVMKATTTFVIQPDQAGVWTFGFNADDGGRIKIDGVTVVSDETLNAPTDYLGTVNLTPGQHTLEYIFFERGGGALGELFAVPGNKAAFDSTFKLIGDPTGPLPLRNLDDVIAGDVESLMLNQNASLYQRHTFNLTDASDVQSMVLNATFDDGAVVYLNGTRVFATQAPAVPAFNSTATADVGLKNFELDLTPYLGQLVSGANVLAVHGLNSAAGDSEYFSQVHLTARTRQGETSQILAVPTPGTANGIVAPVITEFQADNRTLEDEDKDSPDWIEIHNPGQVDTTLTGWYLTDDPLNLTKWRFPATYLKGNEYLVVFASGKDRGAFNQELHTSFGLDVDGDYLALVAPDGTTKQWEFQPNGEQFGQQYPGVSFGLRGANIPDEVTNGPPADTTPVLGLTAYWDFEDGTGSATAADRSGRGNVGTLSNMNTATAWVTGRNASTRALAFDGTNDRVLTQATASLLGFPASTQRSVAGWVRSPATTPITNGGVFELGTSANSIFGFRNLSVGSSFRVEPATEANLSVNAGANTWFHFAITYDGLNLTLYRNGTQVSTGQAPNLNTNDLSTFAIGSFNNAFFRGQIDELAVWDVKLTPEAVAGLANGSFTPLTAPTVNRLLGVDRDGFTVRQVNASSTFPGQVVGQVGSGANPLQDADALLALPAGNPGIADTVSFTYDTINFYDTGFTGSRGLFNIDEPFPLDDEIDDDNHFALKVTAELVVPVGAAGDFSFGVHSSDGSRLRIDGQNVIVDNTRHDGQMRTGTINLTEGVHTLELVYFENTGNAELELLYASSRNGVLDGNYELLEILPDQQTPDAAPYLLTTPRVFFPTPTPGAANNFGVEVFIGETSLSVPHGFYSAPIQVAMSNATPGVDIYYTTNGTEPSPTNPGAILYENPINISSTTVVRAMAFRENARPSQSVTASYLFTADIRNQSPTGQTPAGFPDTWGANVKDYGMDPDIVNNATWGPQIDAALKQIPSMSMVMNTDDLFGTTGIYSHASSQGLAWERPVSLELVYPEGGDGGFQINAGVRIRGGFSRANDNPKHAFRFYFRQEYGASKLEYPLFGDRGVDEFNKFDLRTTQNYSWAFQNDARNTFLRDLFSRDLQLAMGQPSTRSEFYHLYINGQYWGLFMTEERPGADYAASYYGGEEADYDVVHNNPRDLAANDGTLDSSRRLWEKMNQPGGLGDTNMDDYYEAQGMNLDGTRNSSYERLLDVDNLIDYMIITYYTSDADGPGSKFTRPGLNNYFGFYNRENPDGFKFLEHDSEHSLDTGNAASANYNMVTPFLTNGTNLNQFNAHWMHEQLANTNTDYRQRFIDRVDELMSPGGLYDPTNLKAMIKTRADQINIAIIAESARWGDAKNATPYTKTHWDTAVQNIYTWMDNRIPIVLDQFRSVGWYPNFNKPTVDPQTGVVDDGTEVTLFVPGNQTFIDTNRANSGALRFIVPTQAFDTSFGQTWTDPAFNGSNISTLPRTGPIGYETESGYQSILRTSVPAGTTSVYMRPFAGFSIADTDADGLVADEVDALTLRMQYDDGFVAYLNGVKIASANAPANPTWNSTATAERPDADAVVFQDFVLDRSAINLLRPTNNMLSVHGLNVGGAGDTDMLIGFQLISRLNRGSATSAAQIVYTLDGSDPRASGGETNTNAIVYNISQTLFTDSAAGKVLIPSGAPAETNWQSRTYNDASWTNSTNAIGFDADTVTSTPGFTFRVLDLSGNMGTITAATAALNGQLGGNTVVSDTTQVQAYVNHGDAGNLTSPAVLPLFGTDRESYAVRATANITIPVGTWSISGGSDDGIRITIPGVTFTGTFGENGNNGVGTNSVAYAAARGHAQTGGSFTVSGSPLQTTITVDMFEDGGGDSVELSIASGLQTAFVAGTFQVLQNSTLGWSVQTTSIDVPFEPAITTNLEATMLNVNSSAYLRIPFNLSNVADVLYIAADIAYDDGFVVYLNGTEVERRAAPPVLNPPFNAAATSTRADSLSLVSQTFDLSRAISSLVDGQNVLAIHAMNSAANGTDFLMKVTNLRATFNGEPFPIDGNTLIKVRSFQNGLWSPLVEEYLQVEQPTITISEINYNPYGPTAAEILVNPNLDGDDFEFVEVLNPGSTPVNLSGIQFTAGIDFTFGAVTLNPGQRGVVVKDMAAFRLRYPDATGILGVFDSGSLSNAGERLTIADGLNNEIVTVEFSDADPWSQRADGRGATLELIDGSTTGDRYDKAYSWKGSTNYGGSPSAVGSIGPGVVINEIVANTDLPLAITDSIELHNTTANPIDIGGWYLSDGAGNLRKYEIPAGTILAAGGYIVFDEADFNPSGGVDPVNNPRDFALSGANGDEVYLVIPNATGGVQSFVDDIHFIGSRNGEAFGRTNDGSGRFVPLTRTTLGCENSDQRVGPVVISEVQYNPGTPSNAALALEPALVSSDLEFIELHNPTSSAVNLTEWRIRGGADFDFALDTALAAGETLLVISFNPTTPINANRLAAFRAHYGIAPSVRLLGGFGGGLSDNGERLQLQRPGTPPASDPGIIPRLFEDEVLYDSLAPWSISANGSGQSLQRDASVFAGHLAQSWSGAAATPGTVSFAGNVPGDLNGDQLVNATDIDLLYDGIRSGSGVRYLDLDGNAVVDAADANHLIGTILGTLFGDANLDGFVDGSDFNAWNQNKFQGCATSWSDGNFNGDLTVDGSDFNAWAARRFTAAAPAQATTGRAPRAALASPLDGPTRVLVTDAALASEVESTMTIGRRSDQAGRRSLDHTSLRRTSDVTPSVANGTSVYQLVRRSSRLRNGLTSDAGSFGTSATELAGRESSRDELFAQW